MLRGRRAWAGIPGGHGRPDWADGSCSPAYLCTGEVGYDGPTGWGTPDGVTAFSNGAATNTVTVTNPGNQTGTAGTAASLQISATDSASGQTLTYSATGLPPGCRSTHPPA
jgi:hypothetical protein